MTLNDLIGKIIISYDPDRSIDISKRPSVLEYDEGCEEWFIITGIVKTSNEYILAGKWFDYYEQALDAKDVKEWKDSRPIALLTEDEFKQLIENGHVICYEMVGVLDSNYSVIGYKPSRKKIDWDIFNGTPEEFVACYEEE